MSRYWEDSRTYRQLDLEELQSGAAQTLQQAKKKGGKLEPVILSGRNIVKSWWGKAWCDNLESYADYESRLGRGKRYVRAGAVVDLKIKNGKVVAKVQGRRKTPYKVEINISPLLEERCQQIITCCGHKIENLEMLLNGDFPEELKEMFTDKGGLFPSPGEISLFCSCPDWAILCKHVAAVLYGIGVKFDENPMLFFELRGIEVDCFIDVVIESRIEKMLTNAKRPSDRIIRSSQWHDIFGM